MISCAHISTVFTGTPESDFAMRSSITVVVYGHTRTTVKSEIKRENGKYFYFFFIVYMFGKHIEISFRIVIK